MRGGRSSWVFSSASMRGRHIGARWSAADCIRRGHIQCSPNTVEDLMNDEKIRVRMENGQTIDVVILNKRADRIQVVIGEGVHSVKCELTPTRNGLAYA